MSSYHHDGCESCSGICDVICTTSIGWFWGWGTMRISHVHNVYRFWGWSTRVHENTVMMYAPTQCLHSTHGVVTPTMQESIFTRQCDL